MRLRREVVVAGIALSIWLAGAFTYTAIFAPIAPAQEPALARREFETWKVELEKRLTQRFELNDRAVDAALATLNERLNAMNEFRASLKDQAQGFATNQRVLTIEDKVRALELAQSNAEGRSTQTMLLVGVFFTLLTFGLRFLDSRRKDSPPSDRRVA